MVRGLSVLQTLGIFCVSFVIVTSTGSFSRVPFPKDQRTDIKFPPVIRKSDSGIPDGHLRPLGHQRRSEGRAKEYNQVLHPREFWEKHVSKKLPLVFRNAVTKSGAFQNWTDEYLTESYGDIDVLIEKKKEHRESAPIRIKLSTFLDSYHHEDWYVVTVLPDELRPDIQVGK
uniref:Uncharacterized protein LOC102809681 n=1 Tax=Saccoglossus kowalevskii TaxID=10224 RepID=A0ABM0M7F8_SACKO|nr:PREDICTED: uncharacterized protein LOC102809681 [Saccoglossus kowalevskii]